MRPPVPSTLTSPPPRAPSWPLLGSLPGFFADPFGFVLAAQRTRGDLYRLDLGVLEVLALNHPRHARHVFRDRARIYTKGGIFWDSIRSFMGNGLPLSEGELWRRQRRMIQPHFQRASLAAMTTVMLEVIEAAMPRWRALADSGAPFDVVPELTAITMQVIVRTMFGADITDADLRAVTDALVDIVDYMFRGAVFNALPAWMPAPGRRRFRSAGAAIDDVVGRLIARQRDGSARDGSLLATLVDAVDAETGATMDNTQLRDEAIAMFLAGYETTSATVAWALYHLAHSPGAAAELGAEIDAVLGTGAPILADLPQLPRTRWALQEALRLSGPIFWIWRTATEDDEIDGYRVRAGATVSLMVHAMHRHPTLWTRPDSFEPDRFSPTRSPEGAEPAPWMPFGTGQRKCIGTDFAMIEGQLLLARIAQRFHLHPVPERVPRPHLATIIQPRGGLWLRLEHRASA